MSSLSIIRRYYIFIFTF